MSVGVEGNGPEVATHPEAGSAPHIVYGAQVIQCREGWFCVLGDIRTGVVGFGKSPREACEDFDKVWNTGE